MGAGRQEERSMATNASNCFHQARRLQCEFGCCAVQAEIGAPVRIKAIQRVTLSTLFAGILLPIDTSFGRGIAPAPDVAGKLSRVFWER